MGKPVQCMSMLGKYALLIRNKINEREIFVYKRIHCYLTSNSALNQSGTNEFSVKKIKLKICYPIKLFFIFTISVFKIALSSLPPSHKLKLYKSL